MLTRILTALVLTPAFVLLTLYLPTRWFSLVLLVIVLLALDEWNRLTAKSSRCFVIAVVVIIGVCWGLSSYPRFLPAICTAAAVTWIYQGYCLTRQLPDQGGDNIISFLLGVFLLLGAWSGLVYLHQQGENGPLVMISMMAMVWAADSFAYFTGKTVGRHKLAPNLSPNKTVEGMAGGMLGAAIVAFALGSMLLDLQAVQLAVWMLAAVVAAAVSVVGDLYQSGLKRTAGVKDSGSILPGHGGVLDRIDGVISAAPVFVSIWVWVP